MTTAAPQAPAIALCDGSGLIPIPTEDGPELTACFGCPACNAGSARVAARIRTTRDPFLGAAIDDSEVW